MLMNALKHMEKLSLVSDLWLKVKEYDHISHKKISEKLIIFRNLVQVEIYIVLIFFSIKNFFDSYPNKVIFACRPVVSGVTTVFG